MQIKIRPAPVFVVRDVLAALDRPANTPDGDTEDVRVWDKFFGRTVM